MEQVCGSTLSRCLKKVEYMLDNLNGFPHITRQSKWLTNQNGHWTGGFWIGLLWFDRLEKGGPEMDRIIKDWAMKLKCRMNDTTTHDQGFIFGPSCVFGYRITGDRDYIPMIHAGADNLLKQYIPETGFIRAWAEDGYDGISIVDTIMNLPIMWVSGELSDDPSKKELCLYLAERIKRYAIREDFSTYHVIRWDNNYNIYGDTHQGFSPRSCWSRGQAWALYGFANMYRYTGCADFLDTAVKLAEYYWKHLNDDLMPAWDFYFRNDNTQPIDASAASIAASGMALLSELFMKKSDVVSSELWGDRADSLLESETDICLYDRLDAYGIIKHATVDFPRQSGVDESAMYGDYYFAEALYRRVNRDKPEAASLLY